MTEHQGWGRPGDDERTPAGAGADEAPATGWSVGSGAPRDGDAGAPGQPPSTAPGWGPPPGAGPAWSSPQRPGIVPLRPLGALELLEGGFRAISANPRVMLGTSAAVFGAVAVLSLLLAPLFGSAFAAVLNESLPAAGAGSEFSALDLAGTDPVTTVVSLVATTVLTGLLVLSVSGSVIGRTVPAGELWQRVRGRVLALVGLALLTGLVYFAVVLLGAGIGALGFFAGTGAGVGGLVLGLLAGVAVAVWLGTRWAFAAVALLLEGRGVFSALGRSAGLVRGTWWRVFGVLLLTYVLVSIATAVLVVPAGVVSGVIDVVVGSTAGSALAAFVTLLFGTVASILVQPFASAVVALLYTDLRIRQEGLDVELARAAGEAAP
ncbi:glycerophosphoryl diester phosphodiesterase membrane domain-containing protein [uncultured Pseudokineococcus sp.]|uniref:glycerophosphoryl diester phosphodiesterase membrane domain-containing protein n=1 Tax=uncultured Pseudokineococcus sp. TaxID=1642928 RepID=UPI00262EA1B0|nr:glycerophosphoryl diester phosphodiesterase membrane domain-containing protein [uncultured Pseudokineococcus sp.]